MADGCKPVGTKSVKSEAQAKLRRWSARAAQASVASRKHSAKCQIEELKLENLTLNSKLQQETKAKQQLIDTLQSLIGKVIQYVDVEELNTFSDSDIEMDLGKMEPLTRSSNTDYSELPASRLLHMFTLLLEDKFGENSDHLITRVEELETRVTEQAQEIADEVLLRVKLQNGLDSLEQCNTLQDVRDKINHLKHSTVMKTEMMKQLKPIPTLGDVVDGPILSKLEHLPAVKLPAETHIKHLDAEIRESIIRELSQLKISGADWRMFAHRVGIADETVDGWQRHHVSRPMEDVLNEWGRSEGASIRMLHRHLLSSQLRCHILAKRLADCYQVD